MRRNPISITIMVLMLSILLVLTACSAGSASAQNTAAFAEGGAREDAMASTAAVAEAAQAEADAGGVLMDSAQLDAGTALSGSRKLVRTVALVVETRDFDGLLFTLSGQIAELGGYVENSVTTGNSGNQTGSRYASLVARIPKDQVDSFISLVGEQGSILRREESVEDITLTYVDTESRLQSLEIEQERLMTLLQQADKLEDIIALEERLSEVRYQIESYESQMRTYDNQVDYATVNLQINEVERITPVEESVWDRMHNGFSDSLYNIGVGFQNLAVWVVANLPYLALWALFVTVVVLILIKAVKPKRKDQKTPQPPKEDPGAGKS